jgi:hypothetical protein
MTIASLGRTAAVLLSGMLVASAAHAVYRCGNVYQDRPCDDNGPQTHLTPGMKATPTPSGAAPAAKSASPFAASCARAGEEAQKIVWKREGGATQEKQVAELPNTGSRDAMLNIIESVYRKRGSAPEIRAAVEAECIAEKQKEADTAAAMKLLLESQKAGMVPASAGAAPAATNPAAAPASATAQQPTTPVAAKKENSSCPGWRSELESVNNGLRKGGSVGSMEQMQNRRRDVEKRLSDARC